MQRRDFTILTLGVSALGLSPVAWAQFSQADAAAAIRLALERGAESAVDLLGRADGFLGNPKVKIPLPGFLKDAAGLLKATGQSKKVDDLVIAMNRAAEAAVPEGRTLLVSAAKQISVDDAVKIVRGSNTAVTEYFARKTRAPLNEKFLPIVTKATEKVSLAERYNAVAGKAMGFGLVKKEDANIQQYVTTKALDGMYLIIGEEEKKMRADPVKTGSDLLKKVFGG